MQCKGYRWYLCPQCESDIKYELWAASALRAPLTPQEPTQSCYAHEHRRLRRKANSMLNHLSRKRSRILTQAETFFDFFSGDLDKEATTSTRQNQAIFEIVSPVATRTDHGDIVYQKEPLTLNDMLSDPSEQRCSLKFEIVNYVMDQNMCDFLHHQLKCFINELFQSVH